MEGKRKIGISTRFSKFIASKTAGSAVGEKIINHLIGKEGMCMITALRDAAGKDSSLGISEAKRYVKYFFKNVAKAKVLAGDKLINGKDIRSMYEPLNRLAFGALGCLRDTQPTATLKAAGVYRSPLPETLTPSSLCQPNLDFDDPALLVDNDSKSRRQKVVIDADDSDHEAELAHRRRTIACARELGYGDPWSSDDEQQVETSPDCDISTVEYDAQEAKTPNSEVNMEVTGDCRCDQDEPMSQVQITFSLAGACDSTNVEQFQTDADTKIARNLSCASQSMEIQYTDGRQWVDVTPLVFYASILKERALCMMQPFISEENYKLLDKILSYFGSWKFMDSFCNGIEMQQERNIVWFNMENLIVAFLEKRKQRALAKKNRQGQNRV